jgi:(p)ppGpp synthase/HD superfamily hydrolase
MNIGDIRQIIDQRKNQAIRGEGHITVDEAEQLADEIDALRGQAEEARLFLRALEIAFEAHDGQTDKTGRPYILHPLRVMFRTSTYAERIVALLHDVLEDCPEWTSERLGSVFPAEHVAAIQALTRRDDESYAAFIARVKPDPLAARVKLADIADNMDPGRLERLDQPTRERLIEKYAPALQVLTADRTAEA